MAAHSGPNIITEGLVLHLDAANPNSYSGSGTTWKDLSGNGNDGTLVNGVGYDSTKNGSLTFDGNDDYSTIEYPLFTSPAELTIGGFFKKESGGANYETVIHQGSNDTVGKSAYWFGVDSNDNLTATIGARTGVGWDAGQTNITAVYGDWYYLCASWDGSNVNVYINGNLEKTYSLTSYSDPGTITRIGASDNADGYLFSGDIAFVHVYTKFLPEQEIKQNFNALRGRYGI